MDARLELYSAMAVDSKNALPQLLLGKDAEVSTKDWLMVMRPVRAMKESCLKCHHGAKLGATLGVLTFAVSKQTLVATAVPHPKKERF